LRDEHFGVYGLVFNSDKTKLLLVKKTRGPYTDLYDLPGGTPEHEESNIQTLEREFIEELGVKPTIVSDWLKLDFIASKNSKGEAIDFHHKAVVCRCVIDQSKIKNIVAEDISGAAWVSINDHKLLSDLVREALNSNINWA